MYWEISCCVPVSRCWAIYRQTLSRLARASSLFVRASLTSSRTCFLTGALSSRPSSYPQAFSAAAITNTGSELTSEMVGPAGSTSEGAFSCGAWDYELCRGAGWLLLEACASAGLVKEPARRKTAEGMATLENRLHGINKDLAKSLRHFLGLPLAACGSPHPACKRKPISECTS